MIRNVIGDFYCHYFHIFLYNNNNTESDIIILYITIILYYNSSTLHDSIMVSTDFLYVLYCVTTLNYDLMKPY